MGIANFYNKLIQTDAKIKKLRRDYTLNGDPGVKYDLDRSKRSIVNPLSLFQFKLNKGVDNKAITDDEIYNLTYHNLFYPPLSAIKINKYKPKRYKRYRNITGEPTGFVIEKKKIFVQYKPDTPKRKIPKCSHVPKDSKSHESQMKHPFYKNTQRLDELLDKFLDRNLPEIMADPHGLDKLLKTKDNTDIDNSAKQRKLIKNKNIKFLSNVSSAESNFEKDFYSNINNIGIEKPMSTTDSFSVALSVSTVVSPAHKKGTVPMKMSHVNPNLRKLMQINEEDEDSVLYEDFKEVLTDDMESHDETDRSANKKKRSNDNQFEESKSPYESIKTNPPGVHNPNWKGPLPLYPDELNTMIKQAAIENTNDKTNIPVDTYEETNSKLDLNDVQYVEDYVHNKYDKLAKMAQAYSDYGVLNEKKDSRNDNNQDKSMKNRVKLSIQKLKYFNNKLFNRLKKGTESEGIRVEVKPTSSSREDINQLGFVKKIQKHLKFTNDPDSVMQHQSFKPMDSQFVLFSTATPKAINLEDITTTNIYDEDRGAIPSMGKDKLEKKPFSNDKGNYFDNDNKYHYRKRSLKAVEIDNKPENDDDDNDVLENVNRSYEISNDWDTIVGFYRKRSLKFISDQNNTNMESNTVD
ncbi:uncharacterized protein LOC131852198 [Achroia grisella]|uniref:uncharacterized protein LOC131852198 n=1 Tax=Achroia grisella TaxID=688607 RepID=UPI0027D27C08|nr:uncharacterized protein LOC131852198 [Achroia grisella]